MKFLRRSTIAPSEQPRSAAVAVPTLRTDEVSRHAARLVVIPRDPEARAGEGPTPRANDGVRVTRFAELPSLLGEGDLVVVNDAATLPASLRGTTAAGAPFELRLSGPVDGTRLFGVAFGPGDHRTRTEDRLDPPPLGDRVRIAGLDAKVLSRTGRRVELAVHASRDALWQALYTHGRPIQYAHRRELLPLYTVQTAYASRPWSVEMPSAGRPLTWDILLALRRRGVDLAFLTHAAGLSSTGDDALDRALPWPERYEIPRRTLDALPRARRVIAVGTTVVRALESFALSGDPSGIARIKLGSDYRPRLVSGLISGLHAPGESHFELLAAFAPRDRLVRAIELAAAHGLSAHELGDGCLVV